MISGKENASDYETQTSLLLQKFWSEFHKICLWIQVTSTRQATRQVSPVQFSCTRSSWWTIAAMSLVKTSLFDFQDNFLHDGLEK